jgi:hypothetical protein
MTILKNPFGVRNGVVIFVDDLSIAERGNACHCNCPHCDGEFQARMGDVKVHHFAHNKGACDEVKAYLSGLYKMIQQILLSESHFYVPDVIVSYDFPENELLNEQNIHSHIEYISKDEQRKNKITASEGIHMVFDRAELSYDNKDNIQAIELTYSSAKMAIKVMPPDTLCKLGYATPHKDMATLVLDFANDAEKIQKSNTSTFREYLLSNLLKKRWIYNKNAEIVYPQIFEHNKKAYEKCQKKLQNEARKKELQEQRERKLHEQREKEQTSKLKAEQLNAEVKLNIGYTQVKGLFVQQDRQILDEFNVRWVKCELCGDIKPFNKFTIYGGMNHMNIGKCTDCMRKMR